MVVVVVVIPRRCTLLHDMSLKQKSFQFTKLVHPLKKLC